MDAASWSAINELGKIPHFLHTLDLHFFLVVMVQDMLKEEFPYCERVRSASSSARVQLRHNRHRRGAGAKCN